MSAPLLWIIGVNVLLHVAMGQLAENDTQINVDALFINLSNQQLMAIPDLGAAGKLQELYAGNNDIERLPPNWFKDNSNLTILNLSGNRRLNFPETGPFLNSSSIRLLNMSFCNVTFISEESLKDLPNLEMLDLRGNPIRYPQFYGTQIGHASLQLIISGEDDDLYLCSEAQEPPCTRHSEGIMGANATIEDIDRFLEYKGDNGDKQGDASAEIGSGHDSLPEHVHEDTNNDTKLLETHGNQEAKNETQKERRPEVQPPIDDKREETQQMQQKSELHLHQEKPQTALGNDSDHERKSEKVQRQVTIELPKSQPVNPQLTSLLDSHGEEQQKGTAQPQLLSTGEADPGRKSEEKPSVPDQHQHPTTVPGNDSEHGQKLHETDRQAEPITHAVPSKKAPPEFGSKSNQGPEPETTPHLQPEPETTPQPVPSPIADHDHESGEKTHAGKNQIQVAGLDVNYGQKPEETSQPPSLPAVESTETTEETQETTPEGEHHPHQAQNAKPILTPLDSDHEHPANTTQEAQPDLATKASPDVKSQLELEQKADNGTKPEVHDDSTAKSEPNLQPGDSEKEQTKSGNHEDATTEKPIVDQGIINKNEERAGLAAPIGPNLIEESTKSSKTSRKLGRKSQPDANLDIKERSPKHADEMTQETTNEPTAEESPSSSKHAVLVGIIGVVVIGIGIVSVKLFKDRRSYQGLPEEVPVDTFIESAENEPLMDMVDKNSLTDHVVRELSDAPNEHELSARDALKFTERSGLPAIDDTSRLSTVLVSTTSLPIE